MEQDHVHLTAGQAWNRYPVSLLVPLGRSHIIGKTKGPWRLMQLQNGEPWLQLDLHGYSIAPSRGWEMTHILTQVLVPRV